jgi:hypothetical protein
MHAIFWLLDIILATSSTAHLGNKSAGSSNFMAWQLLDQLDESVYSMFPFVITHKGVLHNDVIDDVGRGSVRQQSYLDSRNKLSEFRGDEYVKAQVFYTQVANLRAAKLAAVSRAGSIARYLKAGATAEAPRLFESVQVGSLVCM